LVWLQYLVGTDVHPENLGQIGLREGLISFSGIALIARIWILEKFYLIGALESIFKNLEGFSPESSRPILALHSSPLLAGFERLFNTLLSKLGAYQKELSHWIQYQTEESRYQALGEISALTLHDISAPFQVIQFFTEKVRESPDCLKNPEYVRQLSENVDKAVKMIRSLRAHLADSAPGITSVDYGTSHLHVFQLLEAQFRDQGLENIRFTIDPALMTMRLKITKVDLIHVIFNLIKNSVENLLKNQVAAPRISVSLQEHGTDYVVIEIQDNGTGLSSQRFEELTSIAYSGNAVRESMGLRLVRRVVERNKGTLSVKEGPDNGTHFHLRLFLALVDDQPNPPEEKSETKRFAAEPTDQMSGWGLPPAASDQPAPREEKSPKTGRGPQGT
jgi:signal transduction histidine kinase